jgi:hypothetical protein
MFVDKVHSELSQNFYLQTRITGVKLNGPNYLINVHMFIFGSCNVQSFINFWLIMKARSWYEDVHISRISRSIEPFPCYACLYVYILRQFSMHFVNAHSPTWLMRSSWNVVHCKILILNRGKAQWIEISY